VSKLCMLFDEGDVLLATVPGREKILTGAD
jgi:hypothetical protein